MALFLARAMFCLSQSTRYSRCVVFRPWSDQLLVIVSQVAWVVSTNSVKNEEEMAIYLVKIKVRQGYVGEKRRNP